MSDQVIVICSPVTERVVRPGDIGTISPIKTAGRTWIRINGLNFILDDRWVVKPVSMMNEISHEWLIGLGFDYQRAFDYQLGQFRVEYKREFFDADIIISPMPQIVVVNDERLMTPEEQVEEFSDLDELLNHHIGDYHVYLTHEANRIHLCVFHEREQLVQLFKLCNVQLYPDETESI